MKNLVSTYVEQFRQDRQKQIRLVAILAALAVVVAGVVFWQLHNTGVAMSNEVYCGQEEHVHDENCYETTLVCGLEESEEHVHDDSCYETVLTCEIPEHTHTIECMTDESADVETADDWEATLPEELSGVWSDDVAAVAESQVGYTESTANFQLADDGETHQGYTRYGAWYGNEYGDWDAMFAAFCLNYAGISEEEMPYNSGAYAWTATLSDSDLYVESDEFTPRKGDLIFFDTDENGEADSVGIILAVEEDADTVEPVTLSVIEGNSNDAVVVNEYEIRDESITGYGILPEQDEDAEIVSLGEEEDTNITNAINDIAEEKIEETAETNADDQALFGIEDENIDASNIENETGNDNGITVLNGTGDVTPHIVDDNGHDEFGNKWTFLDTNVSPVASANQLTLDWSYASASGQLSIGEDQVLNSSGNTITKKLLLLNLSSVWSDFESKVTATDSANGYIMNDVGSIRFSNAGTIYGEDVDVVMNIDSVTFYGSFRTEYLNHYSGSVVNTKNQTIGILNNANSRQVWVGLNYNDNNPAAQRYNNFYTYPCVEDVVITISIVKKGTNTEVGASFLQVASDIDIERGDDADHYRGTWAETFSTISGFNGNFYIYTSDADYITIQDFGQVTVSAYGRGSSSNDGGTASYTNGGIYADTSGASWTVKYTEGYCATEVEIYNYTSNDITIQKANSDSFDADTQKYTEYLSGASFYLYFENWDDDEDTGGQILNRYYYSGFNYESHQSDWTIAEIVGGEYIVPSEAVLLTTDENGIAEALGLPANDYYLEEVAAPDGYNLLSQRIAFTVTSYGVITSGDPNVYLDESGSLVITIKNSPNTMLPNTGGAGTTIFYITGAVLICGAAVTLVYRRRRRRAVRS